MAFNISKMPARSGNLETRLEKLISKDVAEYARARGVPGMPPSFMLADLFKEYEKAALDECRDFSREQLRI